MAPRTHRQTLECLEGPRGPPSTSAAYRREVAARTIERKHGNVLEALAKLAFEAPDTATRLKALATLAPYLFPALRGVELTGADGGALTIEIRKAPPGVAPGGEKPKTQATKGVATEGDPGAQVSTSVALNGLTNKD